MSPKLVATPRTEFGKGAARRARRAGLVPAVLYGHGTEPVHVALPGHETFLALKHANALLEIELDGKVELAIAKDVQRDPVRDTVEHVDLLLVRKGEKVEVEVAVHVVGESAPGTMHLLDLSSLTVSAEATHLPEAIEVDVTDREAGTVVHAGEIALPEGVTLVTDPETPVVTISAAGGAASAEEEAEEPAAEDAGAEG